MNRAGQRGFTLIELIVAMAILAILAALAIPSFRSSIRSNRTASDANSVLTLLTLARSEAIKHNTAVIVCQASALSTGCSNKTDWSSGAIVFVDKGLDQKYKDGVDTLIRAEIPLTTVDTITADQSMLTFDSEGAVDNTALFKVYPSDSTTTDFERCVSLILSGTARITDTTDTATCTAP